MTTQAMFSHAAFQARSRAGRIPPRRIGLSTSTSAAPASRTRSPSAGSANRFVGADAADPLGAQASEAREVGGGQRLLDVFDVVARQAPERGRGGRGIPTPVGVEAQERVRRSLAHGLDAT